MASIGAIESFTPKLLDIFGVKPSGSTSSFSLQGSSSTVNFSEALRVGARTYGGAVQAMNSLASVVNLASSDLEDLLKLTDKLVGLTERSARSSTSDVSRKDLDREFKRTVNRFKEILEGASYQGENYLTTEGLNNLFSTLGLSKETSSSLASVFKDFIVDKRDDYLATEYRKGPRPVPMPSSSSSGGDPQYDAAITRSTGGGAVAVSAADLNNDGFDDIVFTNDSVTNGGVLLSNGDGNFHQTQTLAGIRNNLVTDLNEDGVLDIITSDLTAGLVSYLGNGDGTFAYNASYAYGGSVEAIAVDFNGDGSGDIAMSTLSTSITVTLNDGPGSLLPPTSYTSTNQSNGIAAGDFNEDGIKDLVSVATLSGTHNIFLGNGDGTFHAGTSISNGAFNYTVAVGDVDNDGHDDIVSAALSDSKINIFKGNGDGTFAAATTVSTNEPYRVRLRDLNNDGNLDIIATNCGSLITSTDNRISIFTGNGDGTFAASTILTTGSMPHDVTIGDVNGDGIDDIISADKVGNTMSTFLGRGPSGSTEDTYFSAKEYPSLFDKDRGIARRGDAIKMKVDLKELRKQITNNLQTLTDTREVVAKNVELLRATGLALLDLSSQITGSDSADDISRKLSTEIISRAGSSISEAQNLLPITARILQLLGSSG